MVKLNREGYNNMSNNIVATVASELESMARQPIASALSLRHLANELRGTQLYNREQVIACAHEAAEAILEHLNACSALPPEFKGDYLLQSRLIAGMAKRIETSFMSRA